MNIINDERYIEDIQYLSGLEIPWDKLSGSNVMITGATGMIGSCFIDTLIKKNEFGLNCKIYAVGRNQAKAKNRFEYCWNDDNFYFVEADVNQVIPNVNENKIDYIVHLASNTHPVAYASYPVETIMTNVIGTQHLFDLAKRCNAKRVVFASSNEIYGENRGDVVFFDEDYCGYINSNTLRAGYPESKRCGEALCQAYKKQYGIDVVIPRFTRTYGPTMLLDDTKAVSQFIKNGVKGEDIVLKSTGNQYYSYTYVADAVSGLLTIMLLGKSGEAYNIADEKSDIMLKDLAKYIADITKVKVVYAVPDEIESAGFSVVTKAQLTGSKLNKIGWSARYDVYKGISRTISVMRDCQFSD